MEAEMEERLDAAAGIMAEALQDNPLSRLAWLQFIFEGDATHYPPNFSASSDGDLGMGGSSHGGRLSIGDIPYIEIRCDAETFVQVVHGRLPMEQALSSGRLTISGGKTITGEEPSWGKAKAVRESLVRELGSRFAGG